MGFIRHYIMVHSVYKYTGFNLVNNFQEAAKLAITYHIKSEIIGNINFFKTSVFEKDT